MRNFLLKLTAFIAVLLATQVAVSAMVPSELPKEILALDQQLQAGIDTLYLGDSILIYPAGEPTIPEILRDLVPTHTLGDVAHPAYHLDLYERYVNYLVTHQSQVKTVIIPINMRSFSPEWDLRPTYQFEREKTILTYGPLLSSIFYRTFDTFGLFDSPISQADFREATVFNGDQPVGEVAEFEELLGTSAVEAEAGPTEFAYHASLPSEEEVEALKATLIYYYMYHLDQNHRKIQSLQTISRLLLENSIKPIFYITPINYQLGETHLGEVFHQRLAENTAIVEQVLQQKDVDVLNLVFALEAYNFIDTEHLTENGKTYIANVLAAAIEPPQPPKPLTSTGLDDAPTPSISSIGLAGRPSPEPSPTLTLTPTASPSPVLPTATSIWSIVTPIISATTIPSTTLPTATPSATAPPPTAPPTPTPTRPVPPTATPRSLAEQQAGQLTSAELWHIFEPAGNYNIEVYRIRYKTVDRNEQVTEVEANLYVPQVSEQTSFPILIYAPGTTGLGDHCAPLLEWSSGNNWGAYHSYMLEYTAQGLIGVLPNYQGFDVPNQLYPYFISEFQARALLDAARAAYNFFEESPQATAQPMEAVVMAGYSSGGHAVFAARDFAASYAPELPFKGVIGHGPTTNIETLLKEDAVFSPYIVQTYHEVYGPEVVDPADIFQDRWLPTFEADAMTRCVDNVFDYYSHSARQMYRPEFIDALFAGRLQAVVPAFKAVLDENAPGLSPDGVEIPVLILQGTADQIVTPPSQTQFAASLCQAGGHVTYLSYPAVSHPNIRRVSFRDTINWIESVASGALPESNCASLTGE